MTVSYTPPFNLQNNTTADATQVMANFNAVTTSLQNAASSGINSDITALTALSVPITPAQGGSSLYVGGTSGGTANAQTVTITAPSGYTLVDGHQVLFIGGAANTGATTLNVGGTGALDVHIQTPSGDQPLVGGEILAGQWNEVIYHAGDNSYHLVGVSAQLGGIGLLTSITSQATTDLALATNHFASISGNTTITSFGSNANVNFPLYYFGFGGILTLTNNAVSLILPGGVNITTATGDIGVAVYLGSGNWRVISYTKANGTAVVSPTPNAGFNRLTITNNTGTPNTNIDVTAASGVVLNGTVPFFASAISFTINTTTGNVTSTANGMDGEARPTSGWVYLYMISNGTAMAGLGSTSATAPTLPAGYAFSAYMGAMLTDGSANFLRQKQVGNRAQYVVTSATNTAALPTLVSGATGTYSASVFTGTSTAVSSLLPSTATRIAFVLSTEGNAQAVALAPNANYSGFNGVNPVPWSGNATQTGYYIQGEFMLESANVFFAGGANAHAQIVGWQDAVNAN